MGLVRGSQVWALAPALCPPEGPGRARRRAKWAGQMVGCEERLPGQTGRLSGQMVARAGVRSPALLFQAPGGAFLVHLGLNWDDAEGWLLPRFARVLLGHLSPRLRAGCPLLVLILLAASTWPCSRSWRDSQGSRRRPGRVCGAPWEQSCSWQTG